MLNPVLTNNAIKCYPVATQDREGMTMKGIIRSREKCAHCGGKYEYAVIDRKEDLYCTCGRTPRTYYIYLYWRGDHKIVNDKQEHQLERYSQTARLLEHIRFEIDNHTFDISEYKQKTRKQYSPHALIIKWYKSKCKKGLRPTTRKGYREYIRNHFAPIALKMKIEDLREIRTHHIDTFFESLPASISMKTKDNVMVALKDFVNWLRRKEILERNPEFPEYDIPEPKKIWSKQSEALKVVPFVPEHDRPVIQFILTHPLRSGEVCALRVKDFNVEEGYVHIHRAVSLGEEWHRKNNKSYLLALSEKFDVQKTLKFKFPEQYAFLNRIGNPYKSNALLKIWKRACKHAKIEYVPLKYSGRTTIATEALNNGVPISDVAKALGDSREVTEKHYAHLHWKVTKAVVDGK